MTPAHRHIAAGLLAVALTLCGIAPPAMAQAALGQPAGLGSDGPLRRHGIEIPPKPRYQQTLHVCQQKEVPDCYASPSAAILAAPTADARILIYCGTYRRDAARLAGRRNLVLEGVPCADGTLPVIDAKGAQVIGQGPYPWYGPRDAWFLWVEKLEFRGARVGDGNGTPIRVGGGGPAVFYNVIFRGNQNGILVSGNFDGTLYVIDSVFRDNGYGARARTHHIYNSCKNGCATVVLDSYFGRVHGGGNHIRIRGSVIAIGNTFIDEPGGQPSRMINGSVEACRMETPDAEPPCIIAHNYMLKHKDAENAQFINFGDFRPNPDDYKGLVVRDNVALGLRFPSVLIGDYQENAHVIVRDNLLVVKDKNLMCYDEIDCLLDYRRAKATVTGNVVSDDPGDLPTDFPNLRGLGPGN